MSFIAPYVSASPTSYRVSTSKASARTVKRRTEVLESVRTIISGSASSAQLAAEVKVLSQSQREDLLQQVQLPLVIPADHSLVMKADLAIPWAKLRILRR